MATPLVAVMDAIGVQMVRGGSTGKLHTYRR